MKTPIRYAGGKSKAYKIITSHLPSTERIVSPFIGGGSLESRWSSELGIEVLGFDIFCALVNFWDVLLKTPDELADKLQTLTPDKQEYARVKEILLCWRYTQDMLKDWHTDYYKRNPIDLSKIEAAAYYYYNHNLSYGPMYMGWMSKIYENQKKWDKMVKNIRDYKNPNLHVAEQTFDNVIPEYSNDFLYLDPPYYLKKDSDNKMLKGMYPNCNIDVHHTGFDHEKLRDLLHNHKGKFILSYNNCETIREYYKDFDLYYPEWHYSYQLGETRIGENRIASGTDNTKESHEILIVKA
ncbi:DNA adenine Methylase [Synechococcus phage S-PM2]|uniref:site-specific DNA-methyltransferase (adenine-specific) n=1 Tax=Synechococcus phage S-PM2 TaxID=238854 RepID=Q5GQR9_BPSYP|nr:DNA methyltransferase [Synechococcus phage S-PM2]CAF34065.1 DNA adenine Methylase [Synechococcus phage S-PM2]CFW42132.1 DNA adenine Methylase [Synechococcus phage S-PM2]